MQAHEKGSDIRAEAPKGSHFWAHACQNLERVPAFSEDSQRARAFEHALAEISKGLALWPRIRKGFTLLAKVRKGVALLGTALPNIEKGSHFVHLFKRGRTFRNFPARAGRVRSFRAQVAPSKNCKNRAIIFVAFCFHKFIIKITFFRRSCGGTLLVQILTKGFEVLA